MFHEIVSKRGGVSQYEEACCSAQWNLSAECLSHHRNGFRLGLRSRHPRLRLSCGGGGSVVNNRVDC